MDTRYPTTPFEQIVLRALQDLEGGGDEETISKKVGEIAGKSIAQRRVNETLIELENRGYVSSSTPEPAVSGQSGKPAKAFYRIEVFGERALTAPPLEDLPSPSNLKRRVVLSFVIYLLLNLNAWT